MRAFTSARSLVASAALALLAPLVAAASLSPSLASDDPLQVDLLLNVTRPGAVTVVLWEDGYEGGVNGHPWRSRSTPARSTPPPSPPRRTPPRA